ncbi:hypothetical protein [Geodermatophilus sp. SYSU D00766]
MRVRPGIRLAWLLAGLTAALAGLRVVVLAASDRLGSAEAVTAGFPLVDVGAVTGAVIGALVVSRHPRHRIGWLFVVGQLLTELGVAAQAYGVAAVRGDLGDVPGGPGAIAVGLHLGAFPTLALLGWLFLLAPDGRWPRGRWSWGVWVLALGVLLHAVAVARVGTGRVDDAGQVPAPDDPLVQALLLPSYALVTGGVVVAAAALFSRLRHSDGRTREQLWWITLATVLLAVTGGATLVSAQWLQLPAWSTPLPLMAGYAAVPVLTGIGILRHRLFDVDVVLDRAIVLALLTGGATVLYAVAVVVVSGPGPWSASDPGLLTSVLLTASVALLLQPLRSRAARFATRLVYGAQADPYVALADFTRELQDVPHPQEMLAGVARAIGRAVGAAVVRLDVPGAAPLDRWPAATTWSDGSGREPLAPDWTAPVVADRGEVVGRVAVTMPPGRGLRTLERQLLADFVAQVGHAVGNVRLGAELSARAAELVTLTGQLEASRRRLLAARTEERTRFEAAVEHVVLPHLQPLPAALRRLATSPVHPGTGAALEDLLTGTQQAVDALRTVTRGVFPAQLARRGLPAALATHLRGARPAARVTATEWWSDRRLDPRLESTLYFATVDLLDELPAVRSVELTAEGAGRVARVAVVGRAAGDTPAGRSRLLTDRLAVFDGTVRSDRAPDGEVTVLLDLPVPSPRSAEEVVPGGAEPVRVE